MEQFEMLKGLHVENSATVMPLSWDHILETTKFAPTYTADVHIPGETSCPLYEISRSKSCMKVLDGLSCLILELCMSEC